MSRKQQKALEDLKVKAWSLDQMILFFVYLGSGLEDQKETINDIKEIVKFMLPEIMERTAVDLSIQLFYSSKVFFCYICHIQSNECHIKMFSIYIRIMVFIYSDLFSLNPMLHGLKKLLLCVCVCVCIARGWVESVGGGDRRRWRGGGELNRPLSTTLLF